MLDSRPEVYSPMKAIYVPVMMALLALTACQSAPPIPADATADVYFQRAQSDSDSGQFDEAMKVYQDFLTSHPDANNENLFSARYEVAFLYLKKDMLAEAKTGFESILADFNNLDKSAGAPSWVKILSQKKLQEVNDLISKAGPRS